MHQDDKPMAPAEESSFSTNAQGNLIMIDQASVSGLRRSRSSQSSSRSASSASKATATAHAQAEAARACASFAKKENAVKLDKIKLEMCHQLDKTKMEADLEVLHHEKEAAAAISLAKVLEAAEARIEEDQCHHGVKMNTREIMLGH